MKNPGTSDKYNYYLNKMFALFKGINTVDYWNARFKTNWEISNGRLQTALFAMGFVLLNEDFEVSSILDYGCGFGDSLPVLRMKYPNSNLYYYDFSAEAMNRANQFYSNIAQPVIMPTTKQFDLVYSSNVIEHVPNHLNFCKQLISLSRKYIVVQAPYNQRLYDGSMITLANKPINEEHIRTITEHDLDDLKDLVDWKIRFSKIPHAWNFGEQIFFIGKVR